jgi:FAD binding domain
MASSTAHQDAAPAVAGPSVALSALVDDTGGVPVTTDRQAVRRRSGDFFWYSPVLNAELAGKSAEAIVTPRNEGDLLRVAAVRHGVPITPRGSGTGNYGQAVPLAGGIVLDMSALQNIEWQRPGIARAAAGTEMHDVDVKVRPPGFQVRMHASTKRTATIGGFVAGGSGGVGSINYGVIMGACAISATSLPPGSCAWRRNPASASCAVTRCRTSTMPTGRPESSPPWRCRWQRHGRGLTPTRCATS